MNNGVKNSIEYNVLIDDENIIIKNKKNVISV